MASELQQVFSVFQSGPLGRWGHDSSVDRLPLDFFPKKAEYIDTISELHYAKGDVEKAVEFIQVAIDLVPDEPYYKQQLWRFKNVKPLIRPVNKANKKPDPQKDEAKPEING